MAPIVHPGRVLKSEMTARELSANRLSLDIGVPSGRITDILNFRRAITADTAVRLGRYFGNSPRFWLDLQGQYDIGLVEREKGAEIAKHVRPGLDSRHRDGTGEIRHMHGDTLVRKLRDTYGDGFAKGHRNDAKLGTVLKGKRESTSSSLRKRR
jgi:addiction module HigA family antidote